MSFEGSGGISGMREQAICASSWQREASCVVVKEYGEALRKGQQNGEKEI